MSSESPPDPGVLAELARMVGIPAGHSLDSLTPTRLEALTQKQLQDVAKRLNLTGLGRARKGELAHKIWQTLDHAGVVGGPDAGRAGGSAANASAGNGASKVGGKMSASTGDDPAPVAKTTSGAPAAPPEVSEELPDGANGVSAEAASTFSHRFELPDRSAPPPKVTPGPADEPREIPWGYGHDRVTAMPVDPNRLYVYWEVLDESIARARTLLGAGAAGAWLNLRVYDTTGRIFDGSNAHSTFDHKIERGDRQWFFQIGKPTSQAFIEIGLKSHEGYFVKIARSGRVDFPRHEAASATDPEWLTVRAVPGQPDRPATWAPVRASAPGGFATPAGPPAVAAADAPAPAPGHHAAPIPWHDLARLDELAGHERTEWQEVITDGDSYFAHYSYAWEGPATITSWEEGPLPYPVEVPEPVREAFLGKTKVYRSGNRAHVVYGPWQVVIRGIGAHRTRKVLSRWEVFRSWVSGAGVEILGAAAPRFTGASGGMAGASERVWQGASELRFGGASEQYFLGASEVRFGGASEILFAAASEKMRRGASERRFAGASERLLRGASERQLGGASERQLGGASERQWGGASEQLVAAVSPPPAPPALPEMPAAAGYAAPSQPSAYPAIPAYPPPSKAK